MKDSLYIKSRLDNLKSQYVPQSIEYTVPQNERIKTLEWIYNNGEIQSQHMIENRLERLNEELIALQFANETGIPLKIVNAKIQELKNILN